MTKRNHYKRLGPGARLAIAIAILALVILLGQLKVI